VSAADLRARVASQLEALSAPGAPLHINADGATWRLHTVGATDPYAGRYTPSRVRLHAALVEEFRSRHAGVATDGLAAVATAGPPAVGKSTRLNKLGYAEASWRRIDPDDFKTMLIEHDLRDGSLAMPAELEGEVLLDGRGVLPLELAGLYHHESTVAADMAREISLAARENVIIEGTFSWDGMPPQLVAELLANDYQHLDVVLVDAPLVVALARSLERWWPERMRGGLGGRFTSAATIRDLYLPDQTTVCAVNARDLVERARAARLDAVLK